MEEIGGIPEGETLELFLVANITTEEIKSAI